MSQPATLPDVVVLISGGGSNLQAMLDAVSEGTLPVRIRAVIANEAGAFGLERAATAGVPAHAIEHRSYPTRADFEAELAACIDRYEPEIIALAGFMRILTPGFVTRYLGRIVNIHPSLLPLYPGLDTHRRALEAGDSEHGVTVHFVTAELDGGPAILQGRVPVLADDDPATLAARVLEVEHRIYPETLRMLAAGRVRFADGAAWLDDERLEGPLEFQTE